MENSNKNIENSENSSENQKADKSSDNKKEKKSVKFYCHSCEQKLDTTSIDPLSHFKCPSCSTDLIAPMWFANYMFEEEIGIGGMAKVYRAIDLSLDREIAVKVLNKKIGDNKEQRELFLHEARTAATINHFAVIPIYTCGVYEQQAYILMQYMSGGTLESQIDNFTASGNLPFKGIAKWIRDVAEGLDNARRHGIIHHDIKPRNIMLDRDGNAKIGDFGIAQACKDLKSRKVNNLTEKWLSPQYVSPEKVANGTEDYLGDIYSLGASFYHLVCGKCPFQNEEDDITEIINARLTQKPEKPENVNSVPKEISQLIMKMMSRSPRNRPGYRDIVSKLNHFIKKKNGNKTPSKIKNKSKKAVLNRNTKSSTKQNLQYRKKSSWISKIISLLIIATLVVSVYFAWKSGKLEIWLEKIGVLQPEIKTPDAVPEVTSSMSVADLQNAQILANNFLKNNYDFEESKQAAVQLALIQYLMNDLLAENKCMKIKKKIKSLASEKENINYNPENDFLLLTLEYLSDNKIKTEDFLNKVPKTDKNMIIAGLLAAGFKNLYSENLSSDKSKEYFRNLKKLKSEYSDNIDKWAYSLLTKRLDDWYKCIVEGEGDPRFLEPLFADKVITIVRKNHINSDQKTRGRKKIILAENTDTDRKKEDLEKLKRLKKKSSEDSDSENSSSESAEEEKVQTPSQQAQTNYQISDFDIEKRPSKKYEEVSISEETTDKEDKKEKDLKFTTLENLNSTALKEYREKYTKNRPEPNDAMFNKNELRTYLKSLPEDKIPAEKYRAQEMLGMRRRIHHSTMHQPYEKKKLKLRNRRDLRGKIMINPNYISVMRGSRAKRVQWDEISIDQYIDFMEYYADFMSEVEPGGNLTRDDIRYATAKSYFRIAVFCDWYGKYNEAVKFLKKAVSFDNSFKEYAEKYFLQ